MHRNYAEELSRFMPKVMRAFARQSSNALTKGAITVPQMILLEILQEKGPSRMTDLASEMGITTSAVTGLADRLVSAKMIRRIRGTDDRRVVSVEMTSKGKTAIKKLLAHRKQMMEKAFEGLTEGERKTYFRLVQKIHAHILNR